MMRDTTVRALLGFVLASAFTASAAFAAAQVKLLETGSTLLYPLMNVWIADYKKQHPNVQITTQGTGSGTGIAEAMNGTAQIGASDAYLSDAQMKKQPMLSIPLAVSAQQINYNLPEIPKTEHLNFSGTVLAKIYNGSIRYWDDAAITSINTRLAGKLPHKEIVPIHRSDGSGDTFIFTQYLSDQDASWKSGPAYGTTISWPPVPNGVGANGNPGVFQACKDAPHSVAYIGVSYLRETEDAGLGHAALRNKAGNFVLPTAQTIAAAASAMAGKTPTDGRISIVDAPGKNSYPIVNYEYAIVNPRQPNGETAQALKQFLDWAISPTGGNASTYLSQVTFAPLPESVAKLSREQIARIK